MFDRILKQLGRPISETARSMADTGVRTKKRPPCRRFFSRTNDHQRMAYGGFTVLVDL